MTEENCGNCRCGEFGDGVRFGDCRRYPTLVQKAVRDWCGEWEGKAVKPKEQEKSPRPNSDGMCPADGSIHRWERDDRLEREFCYKCKQPRQ